ncbi:bifunctional DNA primase/polymerase [Actinoplanes sp. CA-030573]|uniref:bifunctional DNA primase/polymerase n=1 Tax=Actinoplanes sp. CA-030573 TaxID=3239898 RepID=UPI003D8EE891
MTRGHWIAASKALGRFVPVDGPYPHICAATVAAEDTVSGQPLQLAAWERERFCAACAHDKHLQTHPSTNDTRERIPMHSNQLLTAALSAAARGWHVFPLRPDDKRPAIAKWEQRATVDPDRIRRCWAAGPFNVGIACGPSGLIVLDFDARKTGQNAATGCDGYLHGWVGFIDLCRDLGHPIPADTYAVATARGGLHLYFRQPDGIELRNTAGTLGRLIDTRGHGGYVVAAGSIVKGQQYHVPRQAVPPYAARPDARPAPLPGWLAERLHPAPLRPAGPPVVVELPADRHGAYVRAAITGTLDKLGEAREGGRNRALYMAAQTLGQLVAGHAVAEDTVTAVLADTAARLGLGPREIETTIRSGLAAGARRPRQVA